MEIGEETLVVDWNHNTKVHSKSKMKSTVSVELPFVKRLLGKYSLLDVSAAEEQACAVVSYSK